jgi:hypothetical protein
MLPAVYEQPTFFRESSEFLTTVGIPYDYAECVVKLVTFMDHHNTLVEWGLCISENQDLGLGIALA